MPRNYSINYNKTVNSTGASEVPRLLLEIDHPDLASPLRVVNDTVDLIHLGNTFVAMAFRFTLPDDSPRGLPRARLYLDNVGRELMDWLEASNGGRNATFRALQVLRSIPDVIEFETTLRLLNVVVTPAQVQADLGYADVFSQPAVGVIYTPANAPGLF